MSRPFMSSAEVLILSSLLLVSVVAPLHAVAQTQISPQMRSEARALMQICRADHDRLCGKVQPGGGRILACLQAQASELSPACGQAMSRAQALKDSAAAAGVLPR